MRQHTNKDQTQHLIELGFPKPQTVINEYRVLELNPYGPVEFEYAYSIGELIEFLGMHLNDIYPTTICDLPIHYVIQYQREPNKIGYKEIQGELIDKLYDACVELKNEGMI